MGYKKATAAYSVAHFVVDFSCAFFIFRYLYGCEDWMICLLAYNFSAFAMQMPLGVLTDHTGKGALYAMSGCILVALSVLLKSVPLALCIAAGLGNALFHIGAGKDVLMHSGGRYSRLGIFVSPGALGLFVGTLAGKNGLLSPYVPISLLAASAAVILLFTLKKSESVQEKTEKRKLGVGLLAVMLLCLFAVVCLRSYVGATLTFPWKTEENWLYWLLLALALGKAAGGIFADWLGDTETAVFSLLASAVFFVLYHEPVCGVLAVFFFNMSMPITLGAAARLLPKAQGFSFGLLTFGLFVGIAPIIVGAEQVLTLPWGYAMAAAVSAVLLFIGLGAFHAETSKHLIKSAKT